jgi:Predicted membrane protein
MTEYSIFYLAAINTLSGILFSWDKRAARNGLRRVPEIRLHLFELMGGVFVNWILMYTIRHKNKKFSYYAVTYLLLFLWIAVIMYRKNIFFINA